MPLLRAAMAKVTDSRKLGRNIGVDTWQMELHATKTLACVLAARFYGSPERVRRTQVYCECIGQALGMRPSELQTLRVASLVYDIGLLAVPEAIVSKVGGLTPEEFERIKTHVALGVQIVEQMGLPSAVSEIVGAHHERWNGSGYPQGLRQEDIPLGARILAVVDCFCSLLSKETAPEGGPLQIGVVEAASFLASQSGISFDPSVVRTLIERWCEYESLIDKTAIPDVFMMMEQAKRETRESATLYRHLGHSLNLHETLVTLAQDLKNLVEYDGLAVYIERDGTLTPEYVLADEFLLPDSATALGEGLCARVADSGVPVLNADPLRNTMLLSSRAGYQPIMTDWNRAPTQNGPVRPGFQSLLAVPLQGSQAVVGVLAFFGKEPNSFHEDDLRVLLDVAPHAAAAIENAVKHQAATSSAKTDYLTGLANSRALFERLDDELARCRRTGSSLTVLVCDLDGFKQVNDHCGHLSGNRVLRAVSRVLELNCREYDFVSRMGGDEFVMVFPGLPSSAVDFKRQQLCRAVEEAARTACAECEVTMSVGQARYGEDGEDAESLLAAADARMYRAKHKAGRRRPAAGGYEMAWQAASVQ